MSGQDKRRGNNKQLGETRSLAPIDPLALPRSAQVEYEEDWVVPVGVDVQNPRCEITRPSSSSRERAEARNSRARGKSGRASRKTQTAEELQKMRERAMLESTDTSMGDSSPRGSRLTSSQVFARTPSYLSRFSVMEVTEVKVAQKKSRKKDKSIKVEAQFQSNVEFKINGQKTDFDVEKVVALAYQRRENIALKNVYNMMDCNKDHRVCPKDICTTLAKLYSPLDISDAEVMLWEVDDDSKGYLTWAAFQKTYHRVQESKEPNEPRALFTLIEFMIFDADGSGTIDVEEASTLFRRRYGKTAMTKATALIESTMEKQDQAGHFSKGLSYKEFLHNDGILKALIEGATEGGGATTAKSRR